MKQPAKSDKGFFGSDRFAEFALGQYYDVAESFAASRTHTAKETFGYVVIPSLSGIDVFGDDSEAIKHVRERSLDRWHRHDFWGNALGVEHALQWCVAELIDHGRCFLRVQYAGEEPILAERIDFLAPETIAKRRASGHVVYEQYVSKHAFAGAAEQWCELDGSEIIELHWPLAKPPGGRTPAQAALHAGRHLDALWARNTYALRAGANPDDALFPLVRARAGAYQDSLEDVENVGDRVSDVLFDVPVRNVTEFFQLERLCRQREAAAALRSYLLVALNKQWLDRWSAENGWGSVELRFRAQLWTEEEWRTLRNDFLAGRASIEDVGAAFEIEREEIKRHEVD